MKKAFLLVIIYLNSFYLFSQLPLFSDSTIISLLTCSPGEKVYTKFGHTAIRLNDPLTGNDLIFNYGVFSFDTKNFYLKFIKGETDYQLAVYDTQSFLQEYIARNSMVWEQILNLTPQEKKKLIQSLLINYEPQNRIYRYNFIYDNCSTRPRDKIVEALEGEIEYTGFFEEKTFRDLIGIYTGENSWLKFGIDLVLGAEADKVATRNESMFLPEMLMAQFQSAKVISNLNSTRPLIVENKIIVQKNPEKLSQTFPLFLPISVCLLLLLVAITCTVLNNKRSFKVFDSIAYIVTGLMGLIIFYLMFFSAHPLVKSNFNILWLNPLNLLAGIFLWIRKTKPILFYYQILNSLFLFIALIVFILGIQEFNIASIFLILTLLLRTVRWVATTRKDFIFKNNLKSTSKKY